jgi:hypothetical protein
MPGAANPAGQSVAWPVPAQPSYQNQGVQQSYADYAALDHQDESVSSTSSYREAALTGAWGAVVGIIIFIILYMLTRS